jgi:hypothetical protein
MKQSPAQLKYNYLQLANNVIKQNIKVYEAHNDKVQLDAANAGLVDNVNHIIALIINYKESLLIHTHIKKIILDIFICKTIVQNNNQLTQQQEKDFYNLSEQLFQYLHVK